MNTLFENTTNNESADKSRMDFQTPTPVAKYMASLIPPGTKTILEPTPGEGNILRQLKGYDVTAPKDFFLLKRSRFDCVIMNPPFSAKYAFLNNAPPEVHSHGMRLGYFIFLECLRMSNNVIALMPWFTISDSDVRLRYLKRYGLKSITALPRKTFQYARIQTVVLEMEKGYQGESTFRIFSF